MASGLRQREVRLDLAAVVPAILCLTTYPATVRSVTMPYALRSVIPTGGGDVAQPGTRILGAQQDPCVIGQETASSPRTLTNTVSRNILLVIRFRGKGRHGIAADHGQAVGSARGPRSRYCEPGHHS